MINLSEMFLVLSDRRIKGRRLLEENEIGRANLSSKVFADVTAIGASCSVTSLLATGIIGVSNAPRHNFHCSPCRKGRG